MDENEAIELLKFWAKIRGIGDLWDTALDTDITTTPLEPGPEEEKED